MFTFFYHYDAFLNGLLDLFLVEVSGVPYLSVLCEFIV